MHLKEASMGGGVLKMLGGSQAGRECKDQRWRIGRRSGDPHNKAQWPGSWPPVHSQIKPV